MNKYKLLFLSAVLMFLVVDAGAQKSGRSVHELGVQDSLFHGMKWRNIGPFRGGRVTTVCGVIQDPYTFYFGSTGGGVWKTQDGGATWRNISDGYFKTGSVGAVTVAPSDPNVIYVGMGEAPVRGVMTSHGDGVYRSTDAGLTWKHIGLDQTRHISKIAVHPDHPDWVYVAAQGSPYAPMEDRGIYRSFDGGENWTKVHYVDAVSGACDLSMDMSNPRILYAAYWDHQRLPWYMRSGGPGSGIWKSSDGGDTWKEMSTGLPDSLMGKIGVTVSPADPSRVYAIIESEQGGLYRSDNGGRNWSLVNADRILRARSWYYMHVFADPVNPDKVFVLNAPFMQSTDGGKTFKQVPTPHGDNHALWIHPSEPNVMINGNDGGGNISYNGGLTWSTQRNQPTAQFYRVNADNRFPYYVYGGQQDNSTVAIPNATDKRGIEWEDFYRVGGCESAYTAFDPDDPRYVYAGCYQGIITEYDHELKATKDIMAYADIGLGERPLDMKYRFNWNAPIIMSQHDKQVIYHAANVVLRTKDRGISWEEISPDLTKDVAENQSWGGGPITREGAGGENYHTIMYLAESPLDAMELWVGSDDGLVHLTRDGGTNWENITPPGLDEGMINCIEVSRHQAGKAYVVFNRYKFNDFTPHIFMTDDFGQTWEDVTMGIAEEAHVRVVREDSEREGLLFAGTETGLYISMDDGAHWSPFQLNLPVVPITDLKVHQGDLIAATQGRAFWVLDDLTPLRDWDTSDDNTDELVLFPPQRALLWGGPRLDSLADMGANPDFGLMAYYQISSWEKGATLEVQISDQAGNLLKTFSTKEKDKPKKINIKRPGIQKLVWNLIPDGVDPIKGLITLGGNTSPRIAPGTYQLRILTAQDTVTTSFEVVPDPRMEIPTQAYAEKSEMLKELDAAARELTETVKAMNYVKEQVLALNKRLETQGDSVLLNRGKTILEQIDTLKGQLVQEKQKTFQDVINFRNQLDAKLRNLQQTVDESYPPITQGQKNRAKDLLTLWEQHRQAWMILKAEDIEAFNQAVQAAAIPFISTQIPDKKATRP